MSTARLTPEQKALSACARYVRAQAEVKRLTKAIGDALFYCPLSLTADEANSHLQLAYKRGGNFGRMTDESFDCCPNCIAAHALVQERKEARIALASAKRFITCIGKAQEAITCPQR